MHGVYHVSFHFEFDLSFSAFQIVEFRETAEGMEWSRKKCHLVFPRGPLRIILTLLFFFALTFVPERHGDSKKCLLRFRGTS